MSARIPPASQSRPAASTPPTKSCPLPKHSYAPAQSMVPALVPFANSALRSCLFQLRVRIAHRCQIARARPRIDLTQNRVVLLLRLQLRHPAGRIVDVPKDDRFGRACRFASCYDFAVPDRPVLLLGVNAHVVNPLHAIGALLDRKSTRL